MKLTILLTILLCTGCSQITAAIDSYGSEVAKTNLTVSRYSHCIASPIGAVYAEYDTPEKIRMYNDFCGYSNVIHPWPYEVGPPEPAQ